ncbi:MAG: helix-turn-helix transcriptional regulator [Rhodospirillales bacterium]|nr:helix-turn-helix transcriptional regulator [Rhodospirillales bacterium]MCB9994931.1 helix-turn-helix transcriptional regulator [Rhodospirillales bacterium]
MISRAQIKAARAMLDWSQKVLASHCDSVSEPTIKLIETGKINSTPETLGAIQKTFEDAGIEFLPQHGVRFRDDLLTVLEKKSEDDNVYLRLMDDIFNTVRSTHSEILFSFIDQALAPEEVIDRQLMIRKSGAPMRFLVRYGDTKLRYPLDEYKYLPKGHYLTNPCIVYGNKFALMLNDWGKAVIINDPAVAELKRKEFDIIWEYGEKPETSTHERKIS